MDFGDALRALKDGHSVARSGWGWGVCLVLVPGSTVTVDADRPLGKAKPRLVGEPMEYQPHIDKLRNNSRMEPWTPTHEALLATDWVRYPRRDA